MSRYQLELLTSAQRSLAKLEASAQRRIAARIDSLLDNPRPAGCRKLTGSDYWRIRAGDYRVIYSIEDDRLLIVVVDIGHRREVYR